MDTAVVAFLIRAHLSKQICQQDQVMIKELLWLFTDPVLDTMWLTEFLTKCLKLY